jgi:hypothetical protein
LNPRLLTKASAFPCADLDRQRQAKTTAAPCYQADLEAP